jgi:hypothetical protein
MNITEIVCFLPYLVFTIVLTTLHLKVLANVFENK